MTVNRSDFQRRFKAVPDADDRFIGHDPGDGTGDPFVTDLAGLAAGLAPSIATDTAFTSQFAALTVANNYTAQQKITGTTTGTSPLVVEVNTGHADGLQSRFLVENNANQALVDVNFRGAVVNIGSTSTLDSQQGQLTLVSKSGSSGNPFIIWKPGSISVSAMYFGPNGALNFQNTDLSSNIINVRDSNSANNVFRLVNTGEIQWGSSQDVTLGRKAANTLGVGSDDAFRLGSTTTAGRPAAATVGAGALMFDTDLGKVIVSTGSAWQAVTSA